MSPKIVSHAMSWTANKSISSRIAIKRNQFYYTTVAWPTTSHQHDYKHLLQTTMWYLYERGTGNKLCPWLWTAIIMVPSTLRVSYLYFPAKNRRPISLAGLIVFQPQSHLAIRLTCKVEISADYQRIFAPSTRINKYIFLQRETENRAINILLSLSS